MTEVDWTAEQVTRHEHVSEPAVRICKIDRTGRIRIYLNKAAYSSIGSPEYVQIMLKNNASGHMIKLVPSVRGVGNARRMRLTAKGLVALGGGASLVKRYRMPYGYYVLDDQGIFVWKYT